MPIPFSGFDQLLEKIPESSYIRTEFIFTNKLNITSTDRQLLIIGHSLSILINLFTTKQLFPICFNIEKIFRLLENLHSLLASFLVSGYAK